jgi:hypothetical protein
MNRCVRLDRLRVTNAIAGCVPLLIAIWIVVLPPSTGFQLRTFNGVNKTATRSPIAAWHGDARIHRALASHIQRRQILHTHLQKNNLRPL